MCIHLKKILPAVCPQGIAYTGGKGWGKGEGVGSRREKGKLLVKQRPFNLACLLTGHYAL
jgi:hypothetical protein